MEEKVKLEVHKQKLAEEASYAKELASAAAAELRNLAEEVTKLSFQNAKLTADLAAASKANRCQKPASFDAKQSGGGGGCYDECWNKADDSLIVEELKQELNARHQREASLVAALSERDKIEGELRKRFDEVKQREKDLENELANMRLLVAKLRKSDLNIEKASFEDASKGVQRRRTPNGFSLSISQIEETWEENERNQNSIEASEFEELKDRYNAGRRRCNELESLVLRLKVWPYETLLSFTCPWKE